MRTFTSYYHWTLAAARRASDSILGRFRREFEQCTPTVLAALKIKSLAQASKGTDSKKHRISDDVAVELRGEDNFLSDVGVTSFRGRLEQYEIMGNTWALAGCYDVDTKVEGATVRKKFVHWMEADVYVRDLRKRCEHLTDKFTDASVVSYMCATEEAIRSFAVEKCRSKDSHERWGSALISSMREHSYLWQDNRDMLVRIGGAATRSMSPIKTSRDNLDTKDKNIVLLPRNFATCTHTQHGNRICKKKNDRRGCPHKVCPDGAAHVCDVKLEKSGFACGKPDHTRAEHDEAKHGKAQRA